MPSFLYNTLTPSPEKHNIELWVDPTFHVFLKENHVNFSYFMTLHGKVFREKMGRCTQLITLNEHSCFIKKLSKISWKKIFQTILSLRLPDLSAKTEFFVLQKLMNIGIDAPKPLAFGYQHSLNPTKIQSFIITESLFDHTISLTDLFALPKNNAISFIFKIHLIKKIATIAKNLHKNDIIHQDFYFHHLLLDISDQNKFSIEKITLYLIDFHRAKIQRNHRQRWLIKDLSCIYCSIKTAGLSMRFFYRFMQEYFELPIHTILSTKKKFVKKTLSRGEASYQRERMKRHKRLETIVSIQEETISQNPAQNAGRC